MTISNKNVGFIGAGNMAQSIIGGMLKNGWQPEQIIATAATEKTRITVSAKFGIRVSAYNQDIIRADVVFLCVKPNMMKTVLVEIADSLQNLRPLLISVAAGVTTEHINQWSANSLAIIRSMPNTPSLLGIGACGLFANKLVNNEQKIITESIFKSIGIAEWVEDEALINAVIAVSGSGPAYYFLFMEAMKNAGVRLGLTPEISERLTQQTALGAASMAASGHISVTQLRHNVCSPGGTTEQAVKILQEEGLNIIIERAMEHAVKRAEEMTDELGK